MVQINFQLSYGILEFDFFWILNSAILPDSSEDWILAEVIKSELDQIWHNDTSCFILKVD